jgi:hypothetical protein
MDAAEAPPRVAVSTSQPDLHYELVTDARTDGAGGGPLYRRAPGGEVVEPTGRVLVRFGADERAAEHEADLAAAGFEVDEVLSYAPQAAWVRPGSGRVVDALRDLDRLQELPGVVAVEPQMIGRRAQRD